jgi:ElaB/YqjD/DUF883 family membrane-anchored ribosome-binding protein
VFDLEKTRWANKLQQAATTRRNYFNFIVFSPCHFQRKANAMTIETNKTSPSTANAGGYSTSSTKSTAESLRDSIGNAVDRGKSDLSTSADAARDAVGEDLSKLKADLLQLQKTVSNFAAEAGGSAASTVKDVGQAVASQVSSVASEAAATATDQVKTFASELEGMARRNPLGTLAGTLVVGVLVGMMSRGRS